jgi:hypothetical protein
MHDTRLLVITAIFLATSMVGCRTTPPAPGKLPADKPRSVPSQPAAVVPAAKPKPPVSTPPAAVPRPEPESSMPEFPDPDGSTDSLVREGFACCNLHYEDIWISDANYSNLPMIPVGTPVKILRFGRNRAYVTIGGRSMRLAHDYGRERESLEQWVEKIIVDVDPNQKIASYPALIQNAIKAGRIAVGMTREQVIMAMGYPLSTENPWLGAPVWKMWASMYGKYQLVWDTGGKLTKIVADPQTRNLIVFQPAN